MPPLAMPPNPPTVEPMAVRSSPGVTGTVAVTTSPGPAGATLTKLPTPPEAPTATTSMLQTLAGTVKTDPAGSVNSWLCGSAWATPPVNARPPSRTPAPAVPSAVRSCIRATLLALVTVAVEQPGLVRLELLGARRAGPTGPEDFDADGDERQHHDAQHRQLQVVLHPGRAVAEHVAEGGEPDCPDEAADHVVDQEGPVLHRADPGHDGGEGPDDRDEPGQEDRLR